MSRGAAQKETAATEAAAPSPAPPAAPPAAAPGGGFASLAVPSITAKPTGVSPFASFAAAAASGGGFGAAAAGSTGGFGGFAAFGSGGFAGAGFGRVAHMQPQCVLVWR